MLELVEPRIKKKLFVFDLDDTLMWNAYLYGLALIRFYEYLTKLWENRIPALGSIAAFSEDIDAELGKKINPDTGQLYGFSMERFPTSLVKTYQHLCGMGFGIFDEQVAQRIYRIGLSTFAPKHYKNLVEGAEEVLNFIRDEGNELVLVTKGDKRVQNKKIKHLGIREWFGRNTYVVDNKTPEDFRDIKEDSDADLFFAVGNSFFSDIKTAVEVGYIGIYIPCYTWKVEEMPARYSSKKIITIEEISEIMPLYKSGKLDKFPVKKR